MTDAGLADLLLAHPAADDEPLLYGAQATWTGVEARAEVGRLAELLADAGVEEGAPVAVSLESGAEVMIAMTAIWTVGAVFVPVNHRMPRAEVETIIAETEPAALVEGLTAVTAMPSARRHEAGIAFVLWTSGTTGRPKAVLHTHDAYLELLDRVLGPLRAGSRGPDRAPTPNLIPVPMNLNAGIYNALFGLRAGAPLVFMDRFAPADFAALVVGHEIRSVVLPPAAMAMLVDDAAVSDLGPLRYVRSITAPLSPVIARRMTERFGVTVLNGYGQVEIGEVIGWTAADAKEHPDKIGAIGRPHQGVDIRIDGPDTNGVGELLVRPPNRAVAYATGESLEDRVTDDGFVRTGDLARIDDDGFVWVEGRLGEVINRGGNKVFPAHVEEALRSVAGVVDVAVVGAPDPRLGEVPVAFVVTDAEITDGELEAACRAHLVAYKVPVSFQRVEVIPRTEVGKIRRSDLVNRL